MSMKRPRMRKRPKMKMRGPQFRKYRTHKIEVIARKTQPQWKRTISVSAMKKIEGMGGMVSSTWIESITWMGNWVYMTLLNEYAYNVYVPFRVFEAWYHALSKGTFFNYMIKDKYKVVRAV